MRLDVVRVGVREEDVRWRERGVGVRCTFINKERDTGSEG